MVGDWGKEVVDLTGEIGSLMDYIVNIGLVSIIEYTFENESTHQLG
jgi:hypothetical protein